MLLKKAINQCSTSFYFINKLCILLILKLIYVFHKCEKEIYIQFSLSDPKMYFSHLIYLFISLIQQIFNNSNIYQIFFSYLTQFTFIIRVIR